VNTSYPASNAERDRWILSQRPNLDAARSAFARDRPGHWLRETEPDGRGGIASILTLFLTNRECPWRCLMCDLWQHTTRESVSAGAIAAQVTHGCMTAFLAGRGRPANWLKLYNAGSFFDPRAIPPQDYPAIAEQARQFSHLIVECHPTLVNDQCLKFRDQLRKTRFEIAMGLETAHPGVLEKLNKRMSLESFSRAAKFLRGAGVDVRVFILMKPPFLDDAEAVEWGRRSIDFAFDCGANVVSLIPTRAGNGALEELAREGLFSPPKLSAFEVVAEYGVKLRRGRMLADLWDLEKIAPDAASFERSRDRLFRMNHDQRVME
jgi:radical SAM enzyme (TIGR01210 family)